MARRTKEDAEQTRKALLGAALSLFKAKGYFGTRIADIVRGAGVTKGALYWHFKSKVDILVELTDALASPMYEIFERHKTGTEHPAEALFKIMADVLTAIEENENVRSVMEIVFLKVEKTEELAPLFERKERETDKFLADIKQLAALAVAKGEFRPDLDVPTACAAMLAQITGLAHTWLSAPKDLSLKQKAPELARLFFRGWR